MQLGTFVQFIFVNILQTNLLKINRTEKSTRFALVKNDEWHYIRIIQIHGNLPKISRVKFEKRLNFVIKKNEILILSF